MDSGDGAHDALGVGDGSGGVLGYVEVDAHEDTLVGEGDVVDGLFGELHDGCVVLYATKRRHTEWLSRYCRHTLLPSLRVHLYERDCHQGRRLHRRPSTHCMMPSYDLRSPQHSSNISPIALLMFLASVWLRFAACCLELRQMVNFDNSLS